MELSKFDIAAIRHADDICIYLSARNPDGLVRLVKRARKSDKNPFAQDEEHRLPANVVLQYGRGQTELKEGRVECFAMAGIYHGQKAHVSNILKTLRVGDEVTFRFWPDAHSNGYVAAARLHGDVLYMDVRRKGQRAFEFELVSSVCPDNSARMVRGIPNTESYENAAKEARALV